MTPAELIALPTLESTPWHRAIAYVRCFFDIEIGKFDLDGAAKTDQSAITFDTKLLSSGADPVRYMIVAYLGKPVGLLVTCCDDRWYCATFDKADFFVLIDYIRIWDLPNIGTVQLDENIPQIEAVDKTRIHRHGGVPKLYHGMYFDAADQMLFNEPKFSVKINDVVQPAFRGPDAKYERARGFRSERLRRMTIDAIIDAIPLGVEAKIVDAHVDPMTSEDWTLVILRNRSGTYEIAVKDSWRDEPGFTWLEGIYCAKIGRPSLFDKFSGLASGSEVAQPQRL